MGFSSVTLELDTGSLSSLTQWFDEITERLMLEAPLEVRYCKSLDESGISWNRLSRTASSWTLTISKDGESTDCLGNLFSVQLLSHWKSFWFAWNFLHFGLFLSPSVLSLHMLDISGLYLLYPTPPLQMFFHMAEIPVWDLSSRANSTSSLSHSC